MDNSRLPAKTLETVIIRTKSEADRKILIENQKRTYRKRK